MNRRQWLYGAGLMAGAGQLGVVAASEPKEENANEPKPVDRSLLDLSQYEPKSMLQVQESHVARSRFPLIDFHTHVSGSTKSDRGVELSPDREYFGTPEELLAVMDRKNIRAMVNLTGGYGHGLAEAVSKYDRVHSGRFYTFTEPSYSRFKEPDYPRLQAQAPAVDAAGELHVQPLLDGLEEVHHQVVRHVEPPQRQRVLVRRPLAPHQLNLEPLFFEETLFDGGEDRGLAG